MWLGVGLNVRAEGRGVAGHGGECVGVAGGRAEGGGVVTHIRTGDGRV